MFLMNDLNSIDLLIIEYPTLDDYIRDCVENMGVEAEGLAVYIAPIVLRIQICTVIVDQQAAVSEI